MKNPWKKLIGRNPFSDAAWHFRYEILLFILLSIGAVVVNSKLLFFIPNSDVEDVMLFEDRLYTSLVLGLFFSGFAIYKIRSIYGSCPSCGQRYAHSDYRKDAEIWLCSNCQDVTRFFGCSARAIEEERTLALKLALKIACAEAKKLADKAAP